MSIEYFHGTKEVVRTREQIRSDEYYEVIVSQYWDLFHSHSCSCGKPKTIEIRTTKGLRREKYDKANQEIGATIGITLASISAKLSHEAGRSLTIAEEQEIKDTTEYQAPECGRLSVTLFQLITQWMVEHHAIKGGTLRAKREQVAHYQYEVREGQFHTINETIERLPECGENCQPKILHKGLATIESGSATIRMPYYGSGEGDIINLYGVEGTALAQRQLEVGSGIQLNELPVEIPQILGVNMYQTGVIRAAEDLYIVRMALPTETIKWWQWLLSIPRQDNPAADETGKNSTLKQSDPYMWFLAGTIGGSALRTCTIPAGKDVLLPIINSEYSYAEDSSIKTDSELISRAKFDIDQVKNLELSIDGFRIKDINTYRVRTTPFEVILPHNNLLGVSPGRTWSVSDGYWVMLNREWLRWAGEEDHIIHFRGSTLDFQTEVTCKIRVDEKWRWPPPATEVTT